MAILLKFNNRVLLNCLQIKLCFAKSSQKIIYFIGILLKKTQLYQWLNIECDFLHQNISDETELMITWINNTINYTFFSLLSKTDRKNWKKWNSPAFVLVFAVLHCKIVEFGCSMQTCIMHSWTHRSFCHVQRLLHFWRC